MSLAIPEQLWGTVSSVTQKKGNPDEYEFKMTRKELDAAEKKEPSLREKLAMARELFAEYRAVRPLIKAKETKALLVRILSHPRTAVNADGLFPDFVPAFFKGNLFTPEVKAELAQQGAALEADGVRDGAALVDELQRNEWESSSDLKAGMTTLMGLKGALNARECKVDGSEFGFKEAVEAVPAPEDTAGLQRGPRAAKAPKNYDTFLDVLVSKAMEKEGFMQDLAEGVPEPVRGFVGKMLPVLESAEPDAETPPRTAWNATEKLMLVFGAVMGLLTASILTAMGMSEDCGCSCGTEENPKYIWGVSIGLVAAVPAVVIALGLTVCAVVQKVQTRFQFEREIWLTGNSIA